MQLVPILEILHGKCVYTEHKKNEPVDHVVSEDPFETIDDWVGKGISRIHFVDVDAISENEPYNVDLLAAIKKKHPNLEVQVIGGINCIDSAFIWVDAGADFLVLNGKAARRKNLISDICMEFPGKVIVEVGCRGGVVSLGGGEPDCSIGTLAKRMEDEGVVGMLVTDMPQKGQVDSVSFLSISQLSKDVELPIFANGRIDKLSDLKHLLENKTDKLTGVLLGKIIHQDDFCLNQAQKMLNQYQPSV